VNLAEAAAPLVDLVFPPRCPSCGEAIAAQDGLCAACWSELAIPGEPACALCQRPFGGSSVAEGAICAPCLADPPRHDGIAAATLYNDASRKLVLAFKHGRKIALAPMLARLIAARLTETDGTWLVVPVPLHPLRLWRRGFNQSALLAREIARLRGASLVVDGLVRRKRTRCSAASARRRERGRCPERSPFARAAARRSSGEGRPGRRRDDQRRDLGCRASVRSSGRARRKWWWRASRGCSMRRSNAKRPGRTPGVRVTKFTGPVTASTPQKMRRSEPSFSRPVLAD
jgi:predicted amidophosphoribosyltransferase